jgi:hypothetical protein
MSKFSRSNRNMLSGGSKVQTLLSSYATCNAFLDNEIEKELCPFYHSRMTSTSSKFGIFATVAVTEYDLHLLPWASVAACISKTGHLQY